MSKYFKPSSKKISLSDIIKEHAYKKGVMIILDVDGTSEEALSGSSYSFDSKAKILKIVVPDLEVVDKPLLLEMIVRVHAEGGLTLKNNKKDILESYNKYSNSNKNKEILDFYHPILKSEDFSALKMSLYLRDQKSIGKDISVYKKDIRDRFGTRGANISNLCSAGYFDTEFKNLYEEVSREEFTQYYEIAVGKGARALFVYTEMTVHDIEQSFNFMVEKALKYHLKEFRIHGKGLVNVSKIQKFVEEQAKNPNETYTIEKLYYDKRFAAIEYMVEIIYEE
ncbi:MAG: hypothetical protein ACYDCN_14720 [Bacteroidia bacterium]